MARTEKGRRPFRRPRASGVRHYNRREAIAGYLFIAPWLIGFLVFTVGAMLFSLVISFSDYELVTGDIHPQGADNYRRLLDDPKVATSLKNTLIYTLMVVPLELIVALLLALLVHNAGKRSAGFFRTVFYLPKMTPAVATASVFLLLLNGNTGSINRGLGLIGIRGPQWLIDPDWVKPSIVIMSLWAVSGTMVIFLAALNNVPQDLYESASIDGAGPVRQFRSITLPMISSATFFNSIVLSINAFQTFDQAYLLFWREASAQSPESSLFYSVYLFQQAFRQFDFGFAAAMSWLMFMIIMAVTAFQFRVGNRLVYYEGDRS